MEANRRKLTRSEGKTYERLRSLKLVDRELNKGARIEANPFPALLVTSYCPRSDSSELDLRSFAASSISSPSPQLLHAWIHHLICETSSHLWSFSGVSIHFSTCRLRVHRECDVLLTQDRFLTLVSPKDVISALVGTSNVEKSHTIALLLRVCRYSASYLHSLS